MSHLIVSARLLKAVALCQSTEETRYYTCGVHFERHPDRGVIMVATDGHTLMAAYDRDGAMSGDHGSMILPVPKSLAKELKDGRTVHWNQDETGGAAPWAVYDDGRIAAGSGVVEPIDGTYPDWRRIVPDYRTSEFGLGQSPAFHPAYLERFAKIARILDKSASVTITGAHTGGTAYVTFGLWANGNGVEIGDVFGLLMPRRGAVARLSAPEWLDTTAGSAPPGEAEAA